MPQDSAGFAVSAHLFPRTDSYLPCLHAADIAHGTVEAARGVAAGTVAAAVGVANVTRNAIAAGLQDLGNLISGRRLLLLLLPGAMHPAMAPPAMGAGPLP